MSVFNKLASNVQQDLAHQINKLSIVQIEKDGQATASSGLNALSALKGSLPGSSLKKFEVQINPEKYQRQVKIHYANPAAQQSPTGERDFTHVEGETLTLNFTLDGTGVVPPSLTDPMNALVSIGTDLLDSATRELGLGGITDLNYVTRRILELSKIVYDYVPDNHEPPIVLILWGDVPPFKGKLDMMQINYTLFHPSGVPLRAEVQLTFLEHQPTRSQASTTEGLAAAGIGAAVGILGALISSPDLSHTRTVMASDTLPLMSADVYGDTQYYWQVARANGLTQFRQLEPNTELLFPPLER